MKSIIKYTTLAYTVSVLALPLNKPEGSEHSIELDASSPKHTSSPDDDSSSNISSTISNFIQNDLIKGALTQKAKGQVEEVIVKDTGEVIDYLGDNLVKALPTAFEELKNNVLEVGLASVLAGYVAEYFGIIKE